MNQGVEVRGESGGPRPPGGEGLMEVIAFIRPRMASRTKEDLAKQGFFAVTSMDVLARGKQGGLAYPEAGRGGVRFLPKCMLTLLVQAGDVGGVVATIVRVNRTGEIGDGKIFVAPVRDVLRIRTSQRGVEALV